MKVRRSRKGITAEEQMAESARRIKASIAAGVDEVVRQRTAPSELSAKRSKVTGFRLPD